MLAERDINTQHNLEPHRKYPLQSHPRLPWSRLTDENISYPRHNKAKATAPSQRLLASTKASAAKTSTPRTATPHSPHSQSSRLPRRAPTPKSTTLYLTPEHMAASAMGEISPLASPTDKPLPEKKALPSRPIASLTSLSPSKGRTLIDAVERPSCQEDWPVLQPRSSSLPRVMKLPTDLESTARLSDGVSSLVAAETELTDVITGKPSTDGGSDSYRSSTSLLSATASPTVSPNKASFETARFLPNSHSSLNLAGLSEDSRVHSPSPASFSRPRPSSFSRNTPSPATVQRPTTANSARALRSEKTASRIPIPDQKKATLIDVKSRLGPGTRTHSLVHAPSFGSRRLDAPDALKILDQGTKRRQQSYPREAAEHDRNTTALSPRHDDGESSPMPLLDSSRVSSTDEESIVTPPDRPSNSFYHKNAVRLFDNAVSALGKTPPSTSPWTDPLQSIPSQTMLSFSRDDGRETTLGGDRCHHESIASSMQERALPVNVSNHTDEQRDSATPVPESARNSLIEFLNEYVREDKRPTLEGLPAIDEETREQITCTLSSLEGKGEPPQMEVTTETLLAMFEHLKRRLDRVPKTTSLVENAVVAERYLAGATKSVSEDAKLTPETIDQSTVPEPPARFSDHSGPQPSPTVTATITSKWSSSTSSLKDLSAASEDVVKSGHMPLASNPPTHSPTLGKMVPARSIGYPYRISGRPSTPNGSNGSITRRTMRQPSPTIGKERNGSVRMAREIMQKRGDVGKAVPAGQPRRTATRSTLYPQPSSIGDATSRGRMPSAAKARDGSNVATAAKNPRARSKSRYVLDKLNGLFTGKRDSKPTSIPPVPAISATRTARLRGLQVAANGSPVLRPTRIPSMPKMPTMSASIHPAFRRTSHDTTYNGAELPTESISASEDSIAIQDWSESLIGRAQRETQAIRKERLLNFAKVLNDSLINAREAQISAETAQHAARSAQLSYEMTQKSVAMLHRLATSLNAPVRH